MRNVFAFILLIVSAGLIAQESGTDWLEKMNSAYSSAKSLSFSFEVDYYSNTMQTVPMTKMTGTVRYSGTNYYSDAMDQIVVVNSKYMLLIDKTQHTITCMPGSGKGKKPEASATGQPDSAWVSATQVKIISKNAAECRLEIISKNDPVYEKTQVTIDVFTHTLEQVVFFYKKLEDGSTPKLVVNYSNVKLNSSLAETEFSEAKYILKKGGKLIPVGNYSSYRVIDLMDGKLPEE